MNNSPYSDELKKKLVNCIIDYRSPVSDNSTRLKIDKALTLLEEEFIFCSNLINDLIQDRRGSVNYQGTLLHYIVENLPENDPDSEMREKVNKVFDAVISFSPDLDILDSEIRTPLNIATRNNKINVINKLEEYREQIQQRNNSNISFTRL